MNTASSDTEKDRTFKLVVGKSRRQWLIANCDNPGDWIYAEDLNPPSRPEWQGFGGSTINFLLEDGTTVSLKGPWHSNSKSLLEDTGIDLTDKHETIGIIGTKFDYEKYNRVILEENILFKDENSVIGEFGRINKIAQKLANERGETVCYIVNTTGGSSSGFCKPVQ